MSGPTLSHVIVIVVVVMLNFNSNASIYPKYNGSFSLEETWSWWGRFHFSKHNIFFEDGEDDDEHVEKDEELRTTIPSCPSSSSPPWSALQAHSVPSPIGSAIEELEKVIRLVFSTSICR